MDLLRFGCDAVGMVLYCIGGPALFHIATVGLNLLSLIIFMIVTIKCMSIHFFVRIYSVCRFRNITIADFREWKTVS
jgi:hypothetical protein